MKHLNITDNLERLGPSLIVTDSKVGRMAVYKNDSVVSPSILLFGEYCDAEVQVMAKYLTPESIYLDRFTTMKVGALHDFKNLTIKFDYDPIINTGTFGLGVNF